jgi:hypothetical protein
LEEGYTSEEQVVGAIEDALAHFEKRRYAQG